MKKSLEDPNLSPPPPPVLSQPFLLPAPETHPGKKSAPTCKIRKDRLQKYPQTQKSSRNRVLREEEEECADGCFGTSCRPPLLLLALLFSFACTFSLSLQDGHYTTRGHWKCKSCRPQQRLQWLLQKMTPCAS